ncbi:uncharacterized protein IL334_000950 [Kwoniella shivajii]|uniref:Uncharacterized protein n=1 Tax=Kwoniella shivajii TaxID=564305 RepID=A0ABZ1CQR7_9TREE|nr:hypothetical protein IL334_000950 [Kwoniella shivajii]
MPTWATEPKTVSKEENPPAKKKNQKDSGILSRHTSESNKNSQSKTKKASSRCSSSSKDITSEGKKGDEIEIDELEETPRRGKLNSGYLTSERRIQFMHVTSSGHFGMLDSIIPPTFRANKTIPASSCSKTSSRKKSASSSKKTKPAPNDPSNSLKFTKSDPGPSTNRKGRKSKKTSERKGNDDIQEEDDGCYDHQGFWISTPRPLPSQKDNEKPLGEAGDQVAHNDACIDETAHDDNGQTTPPNRGTRKEIYTSPLTPPLTDLRTPAFQRNAFVQDPQTKADYAIPLLPPQTHLVFGKTHLKDIPLPAYYQHEEMSKKEPLFLPMSPDTQDIDIPLPFAIEQSEEEEEMVEYPLKRPTTRRATDRVQEPYLSPTDSPEPNGMFGAIPAPNILINRLTEDGKKKKRDSRKDRQPYNVEKSHLRATSRWRDPFLHIPISSDGVPASALSELSDPARSPLSEDFELIPNSSDEETAPPAPFILSTLSTNPGPPSRRAQNKSKSTSRKTITYGKGRSHAFRHGIPLPHATSQNLTLGHHAPSPSYHGAKRKGSTSIWPNPSSSSSGPDGVDALELDQDQGDHTDVHSRPRKKKRTWTRNGPRPDERLNGLFGEVEARPYRYRHRRSKKHRYPVTSVFKIVERQEEGEDEYVDMDHDSSRRREKRRKREIEKRYRVEGRDEGRLQMSRNKSCQPRIDGYLEQVKKTLTLPKKALHDSKAARARSYKRLRGVPGYASKPIDTIPYSEYVAKYKQPLSSKSSSSSQPTPKDWIGGRVNELIAAGRKARFELAIRKQRPNIRDITPRLPLVPLKPTQDDPQNEDEIDAEPSRPIRRRGPSLGLPLANKIPRLPFTAKDPNSSGRVTKTSDSTESSHPRAPTSVLRDLFPPPILRSNRRKEMPSAFRQSNDPPERNFASQMIALSETPPSLPRDQEDHVARDDPIVDYTQGSQFPSEDTTDIVLPLSTTAEPAFQVPQDAENRPSLLSQSETPSQFWKRLDVIYPPDAEAKAPFPHREDIAPELTQGPIPITADREEQRLNSNVDAPRQSEIGSDVPPLPASQLQLDFEALANKIDPLDLRMLVQELDQQEADRISKKNSRSRDVSQKHRSKTRSIQPSQQVIAREAPSNSPTKGPPNEITPDLQKSSIVNYAERHPCVVGSSAASRRMSGMEVTEHLLQRALLPAVVQSFDKTFVNTSKRGASADGLAGHLSRKDVREERAKRILEKRENQKAKEKQTTLNFKSSQPLSKPTAEVAQHSSSEEEEEIEQVEPQRPLPPKTLSEAYLPVHPPPSAQPRVKKRDSAPSKFNLGNKPVVKSFKDAKQPSAQALAERNQRLSRDALGSIFVPPVGPSQVSPGQNRQIFLEPTQLGTQSTQAPPAAQRSRSSQSGFDTRDDGLTQARSKQWRSGRSEHECLNPTQVGETEAGLELDYKTQASRREHSRSQRKNQGGNPFKDYLTVFEGPTQLDPDPTPSKKVGKLDDPRECESERRKGKRHMSTADWKESQDG